ncbi:hypothetical protein N8508_00770 [bacterium]|nr:hypothetical protein [bacterium]
MWQALIGPITGLVGDHFKRKSEEKRATHDRKMEAIRQDANWENIHAANASSSWRDEFFSLLFSLPLIMCFIPPLVPYVRDGFEVLEAMPEYYRMLLAALVASSVGIRGLTKWKG